MTAATALRRESASARDDRGRLGSGKTTTASVLLGGEVAAGRGFVILDGKGGRTLPEAAVQLGHRYRRPVALWSILPYGDAELDERRRRWNPVGGGNATEIKDRIASAEEQSEPYYAAIAARGLLCAAQVGLLAAERDGGEPLRLDRLAALLEQPGRLAAALRATDAERFARGVGWLGGLTETERSGLRGMGTRLATMVASDGGEWLLPDPAGLEIDLHQAICDGWLVVVTLPQGTYPALIPHVCRYAIAALNAAATRVERAGTQRSSASRPIRPSPVPTSSRGAPSSGSATIDDSLTIRPTPAAAAASIAPVSHLTRRGRQRRRARARPRPRARASWARAVAMISLNHEPPPGRRRGRR